MEGVVNPFVLVKTHGFTVRKHLNWDDMNWVAITPEGSVVVFRDRTDYMLYAIYNPTRGRYHVHIPYDKVFTFLDERAGKVLEEVHRCLRLADCYVEEGEMVYTINRFRLRYNQPFGRPPWRTNLEHTQ